MHTSVEASIVIPVFNQWHLTQACLLALKETLTGKNCEVIVVDNASTDATREECLHLGKNLFGDFFHYHRAEVNLNFGPASNVGAKIAKGEFLIFLNNDTVPLLGWYEPLLRDFVEFPDIAATGPLLLYPESEPFGFTIQHLGVFVSPTMQLGHLYEGIPSDSTLAKKRRFFQVITAACMVMRRSLFYDIGMFDEGYINGFEDVDLCARLWDAGYRMTVNPVAKVIHHTSQTPNRHKHEKENADYLTSHSLHLLTPDWHIHLKNDGYMLRLSPWQVLQGALPESQRIPLRTIAEKGTLEDVYSMLLRFPLWEEGYCSLIRHMKKEGLPTTDIELAFCKLWPAPEPLLELYDNICKTQDRRSIGATLNILLSFCKAYEAYVAQAMRMRQWTSDIGLEYLASQYSAWTKQQNQFRHQLFLPFLRKLREQKQYFIPLPEATWAYTLWREIYDLPNRIPENSTLLRTSDGPITFSVLMPVYNPKQAHITAAIASLMDQSYPHWELCIADDASSDPAIKPLLEDYAQNDKRIRVTYRDTNGHIAAATNTALQMATNCYTVLMDQDDLLTPDALQVVAETIQRHPKGLLFYSDEDKITDNGDIFFPYFKNGAWDADLLLGQNMINHLGVYSTARLRSIGGFREGFNGAQDYDMLLRFTEGIDPSHFIHIPQVLYHWRAHESSTAASMASKPETLLSAVCALQQHLERMGIDGDVDTLGQYTRLRYALPKVLPSVSLIIDLDSGYALAPPLAQALLGKTQYPSLEVIFVYTTKSSSHQIAELQGWASAQPQIKILPQENHIPFSARMNAAVAITTGEIIGFLGVKVLPLSDGWLEEIVSHLTQNGVGAIGGRIINQKNRIYHQGYIPDTSGCLVSLFRGASIEDPGYFSWLSLARTVAAVEPRCLFTHKEYFNNCDGLVPSMGGAGAIDYCLRLAEKRLRTVTTPFATFLLLDSAEDQPPAYKHIDWESNIFVNDADLHAAWSKRIAPCSPHLEARGGSLSLHWDTIKSTNLATTNSSLSATPATSRKKILFIAHDRFQIGAPRSLLRLMRWLHNNTDYDMGLLALLGGPLTEEFEKIGPVVLVRNHKDFLNFGPKPTLVEVERALPNIFQHMGGKPDCILGNSVISALTYPILSQLEVPIITQVAELSQVIQRSIEPYIIRQMLEYTNSYVAVSTPVMDMLQSMQVPRENINIIHGCIEHCSTELDAQRRKALLESLGFQQDLPIVWGCGVLGLTKGTDLFYDTCAEMYHFGMAKFQAIWAGKPDGSITEWSTPYSELAETNFIATPGYITKPYLLMQPGDIFFLSSREDPFPLVALEAAMSGVALAGFKNSGGMVDVIQQCGGLVSPMGDTRHMAKNMAMMLKSPEKLIGIGQKAKRIVSEFYSIKCLGPKWADLFKSIIGY